MRSVASFPVFFAPTNETLLKSIACKMAEREVKCNTLDF